MEHKAPKLTVFIVDRNPVWRSILVQTVRNKFVNIEVRESDSGEEALNMAFNPPDLVITELDLADLDGYEFIERLRKNAHTASTPVLVVHEGKQPAYSTRLSQLRIESFLNKPFNIEDLLINVEAIFRRVVGPDSVEVRPRNAVRRAIDAPIFIEYPVCGLTTAGFCLSLGVLPGGGAEIECDMWDLCRLVGAPIPPADNGQRLFRCVVQSERPCLGDEATAFRIVDPPAGLADGLAQWMERLGRDRSARLLKGERASVHIHAQGKDLSASGALFRSPLDFLPDERLTLDLSDLARRISIRATRPMVVSKVVRCVPADGGGYDTGAQFEQASPDLINEILKWTARGGT